MRLHRFERFTSTHALCGISYGDVCDRADAYVNNAIDEKRFPITCPECIAKSSRQPPLPLEVARPSLPAPMVGDKRDGLRFFTDADDAMGVAAEQSVREQPRIEKTDASIRGSRPIREVA